MAGDAVVRWRPSRKPPVERALSRALALRPRLRRAVTRAVFALSTESRLRRLMLDRTTRAGFAYFNEGDIRMSVAFHADHAEVRTPLAGLDLEMLRGPRGAARTWQLWTQMWEESRRELEEIVDAGDRTLFVCTFVNVGRDGLEVRQPVSLLFLWEGGEIVLHQEFIHVEEAMRAVDSRRRDVG